MTSSVTSLARATGLFVAAFLPGVAMAGEAGSLQADWSGTYIGLSAGAGWASTSIIDGGTQFGTPPNPPYGAFACAVSYLGNYCDRPFELTTEGFLAALQFGANRQDGHLVYGLEVEIGWADISETRHLIYALSPNGDSDIGSVDIGAFGTVTARLGYALDDSLLYLKGGFAAADIENTAADLDQGVVDPTTPTKDSGFHGGWALGGGWEQRLTERLSLKAEYLYMDFGSSKSSSPAGDIYEHDNELHTARLGINWHLDAHCGNCDSTK